MTDELISRELAEAEVTDWLDQKKIFKSIREKNQASIDDIVDAIMNGVLVRDKIENTFTHTLLFPLKNKENEVTMASLKYSGRLNDDMMKAHTLGIKPGDSDQRLLAYLAGLTGVVRAILAKLDSSDKKIGMAIATFFL